MQDNVIIISVVLCFCLLFSVYSYLKKLKIKKIQYIEKVRHERNRMAAMERIKAMQKNNTRNQDIYTSPVRSVIVSSELLQIINKCDKKNKDKLL